MAVFTTQLVLCKLFQSSSEPRLWFLLNIVYCDKQFFAVELGIIETIGKYE